MVVKVDLSPTNSSLTIAEVPLKVLPKYDISALAQAAPLMKSIILYRNNQGTTVLAKDSDKCMFVDEKSVRSTGPGNK